MKRHVRSIFCWCIVVLLAISVLPRHASAQQKSETFDPFLLPTLEGKFKGETSEYRLGIDDVVQVTVRNQDELSGHYIIHPNGKIQYAFVGDIQAAGLTREELKSRILDALEQYVKSPEVTVAIAAYRSKFVYMLGEVGRPGKYPMRGDAVDLREAIVAAGLPTDDAALRRVQVITPHETDPIVRKVDLYEVLYLGKLENDLELMPNDVVVVSSTVPAEIAKALRKMLSPFNRVADVDDFYNRYH